MNPIEVGEDFVKHYFDQVYDPVKAHQYYEDHKKLTGRKPGSSQQSSGKRSTATQETAAQRKAKLDAEIAALKARLEALRALLKELVAEAKKRSGVEDEIEGETSADAKSAEEKLTPSEKADQAKKAHDYYEKTKGTLPSQESTHVLKQKIALIEKKIAEMRAKLASLPLPVEPKSNETPSPSGPENTK